MNDLSKRNKFTPSIVEILLRYLERFKYKQNVGERCNREELYLLFARIDGCRNNFVGVLCSRLTNYKIGEVRDYWERRERERRIVG